MFTAKNQKNKATAKTYFSEHLSHNDYYSQGEVQVGRWIGLGGERLGLFEGTPVTEVAFMRLCANAAPSGNRLTQRINPNRLVFFDFTCSAPKSVSIMAVTMSDDRITRAHELSARFALKELERFASTRVRADGQMENRTTANLVGAEFLHTSSRALDPQLHTHFTLFNATYDAEEARWKALQNCEMFRAIHYATAVYRNELAKHLHSLGYATNWNAKGEFQIRGVSEALCDRFSKRAQERDRVVAEMEERFGRKLGNNEISNVIHQTRTSKLTGISSEEVRERQLAQMSAPEIADLTSLRESAAGIRVSAACDPAEVLQHAGDHLFERNSVVSEESLLQLALIEGRGCVDLTKLKQEAQTSASFIRFDREYSTPHILETERYLVEQVNAGKNAVTALQPVDFSPSPVLGKDQRSATDLLLQSRDRFTGMQGLAGTGKSTTLKEVCRGIRAAGFEPVVCAPTASATDVLCKDGLDAVTLQRLLIDPKTKLDQRTVLILDEAGAVGIDAMRQLFAMAVASKARVILSGDTGQHASVARGDALRILEKHSRFCFGQLTEIRRQSEVEYRKAVELAANQKPAEAFKRLDEMGAISESENPAKEAVTAYLAALNRQRSVLLVSPTWAEIERITEAVRSELKDQGKISSRETSVEVVDSLSWTNAQKRSLSNYEPGQVLAFHQRAGNFKAHETVIVISVEESSLRVQRQASDGTITVHRFHPGEAKAFDVCQRREIKLAPGDKLLLQANRSSASRGAGLVNGELVEVESIENGQVRLTDGRLLPPSYQQYCHGYAVTSHASQGKTVDEVVVVASIASFGAVNREQFYVSISRGRERCQIYTDDKEALADRIGCSRQRIAAMELVQALRKAGYPGKEPESEKPKAKPEVRPPNPVSELIRIFQELLRRFQPVVERKETLIKTPDNQPDPVESQQISKKTEIQEETKGKTRIAPIRNPLKNPIEEIRMAAQRWKQQVQIRQRVARQNEIRDLRIRRSQRQENSRGMRI